ncbi:MAG: phospho-sugar mutase [Balneolaceae bacterium]
MDGVDSKTEARIEKWLKGNYDGETKSAIQAMIDEERFEELTDAFYRDLEFGTGGLRGIMGVGTNRMNRYTLGAATQGLSNYLKSVYPNEKIRVVIAHDNRNRAEEFARITAEVFSANDIYVFLFDALRPTPELSFAIRELGCHSGVMLTASHNPKEYNGYKAYWRDGGQVIPPHDKQIIEEVTKIDGVDQIRFDPIEENIETVGSDIDRAFVDAVKSVSIYPKVIRQEKNLSIVFSPIHGTAVKLVPQVLREAGFENIHLVEEQCTIDGNFSTVIYPNPEEKEALTMSLEKAVALDADLVMATDPDGDRVGIAVKNEKGEFELLNGNQTGTLLFYYLLNAWREKGKLSGNQYIVKTIVTTYLIDRMAEEAGVECFNVLTGFKYIGETMTALEEKKEFIAGAEESYGYLIGDHVRDKDAVVACLMIAEMAAFYKAGGRSLYEVLIEIYETYGFFKEGLISIKKEGKKGAEEIREILNRLRSESPKSLGGDEVVIVRDFQSGIEKDLRNGSERPTGLPSSNVLQFETAGNYMISVRPSGTEPKIKFYISVNGELENRENYRKRERELDQLIQAIASDLES